MSDVNGSDEDIFYVCKRLLEEVKEKLKLKEDITEEMCRQLAYPDGLKDEEIMTPVDMRGVGEDFDDVDQMLNKLGPKGFAEALIKSKDYFAANHDKEPEESRPKDMTAKDWAEILGEEEDDMEIGEEEFLEGEEEEIPEEEADGDGAEAEEPAAKKAKTS
eukprot:TRINITY_DN256_c0_g1_i1.p1 TRINITY_DN256_c0_g1~~TRINITY_DN256_c0_g1_i1.p1  ORF type:complete len:185 (+),score=69.46 TRINITY_DN256_c0_g1_i1:75-557(+)